MTKCIHAVRSVRSSAFDYRLMICTVMLCCCAHNAVAGQFTPPDLTGFTQHSERKADGDGDGVKETLIVQYLNPQGDSIVSMSTKGRVWAWSLETLNNNSSVHNYVIRDSDCDGVFDEVYSLDDKFHVPDCVKK
jgi:hypothetical protein